MNKKLIIALGVMFFLMVVAGIGIYAKTVITDNQITAQNFNMSGGRFNQEANILTEIGYIRDDSVGGAATHLDVIKQVLASGKYAYTLSRGEDAFCIFDVYNPSNITEISCIQDNSQNGTATYLEDPLSMVVNGKYAYVFSYAESALSVFDISDPTNITEIGYIRDDSVGGKAHLLSGVDTSSSVYISGKYLYFGSNHEAGFSIFDISDPTNIIEIGYIQDDSLGGRASYLRNVRGVSIQGNYAYVISNYEASLSIFDISDPTNITEVGYIRDDSQGGNASYLEFAEGIYVSGNYAYVTSKTEKTLSAFDISNPRNITEVGYIRDKSLGGTATLLSPSWITGAGDYVYLISKDYSLTVVDISNPYKMQEIQCILSGSFEDLNGAKSIFLNGDKLYTSSVVKDSFSVFEISGIETPSVKTGTLEATLIDVLGNLRILRDVYIGNGLNVAGTGLFSSGLSVVKSLELIGNFTINNHQGISGNYSNGNCWTAYSGGIIYETNCTSN